jgi:hypothetical protein
VSGSAGLLEPRSGSLSIGPRPVGSFMRGFVFALVPLPIFVGDLIAQSAGPVQPAGETQFVVVSPQVAQRSELDMPAPPKLAWDQNPKRVLPLPAGGPGLPEPDNPPHTPQPLGSAAPTAGQFRTFYNEIALPAGATASPTTCEPTCAIHGDTAFYTGNWFAGLSADSGKTWTRLNPATRFPARDSGFCCDQRALVVPNVGSGVDQGMTLWLLEYGYSATTQMGSLRLARAKGRAGLHADEWHYWDLTPALFGLSQRFLDYSDISYSNGYFFGSCLIGDPVQNVATGLLVYRIPLTDLWNGGNILIGYRTSTTLGGYGSYRFAQGSTDAMHFAAHTSVTTLRVFRWLDSEGSPSFVDRVVSPWNPLPTPAPGPDGRDWTGFAYTTNTVLAGAKAGNELSFWWTSGSTGPTRPQTFVRAARFSADNARNLIGQFDMWHPTLAFHFPSAAGNALGHVGGTFAYGGGTQQLSLGAFLLDQYASFANFASYQVRAGARGPNTNRWGDYFMTGVHSLFSNTFVGAGHVLDSAGAARPAYLWFGRDDYQPTWVGLDVQSSGVAGVPIIVDHTDRANLKNGTTNFRREYPPRQRYRMIAPATHVVGGATYVFTNWALRSTPAGSFIEQPAGELVLAVDDIGSGDDTAIARYSARRLLQVRSVNPASGVAMTVSTADLNGNQNGTTGFDRVYLDGTLVGLTAPTSGAVDRPFRRWVLDGLAQAEGNRTLAVPMTGTRTAVAEFFTRIVGSVQAFGAGCPGTRGSVPSHTGGRGTPRVGESFHFAVDNARGSTAAVLFLSRSNSDWLGIPLPVALGPWGMGTCVLYVAGDVQLGTTTDRAGSGAIDFVIPPDPALIATHLYSQYVVVDPGTATPLQLVLSNALDLFVGGDQ